MKQDATATAKGFIYQFYEAIDWCWKLEQDESLYIETFGDISISESVNIEVKNVQSDLTDMGESFWKTLGNWLDEDFEESNFKTLILITTQRIGSKSLLCDWNSSNLDERKEILKKIMDSDKKNNDEKVEEYNRKVSSETDSEVIKSYKKPKLNSHVDKIRNNIELPKIDSIISKFIIMDSSPMLEDRYKTLCDVYGKSVLLKNVKIYINSQVGFILSPVSTNNKWVISYDDFSNEINHLTQTLSSDSRVFPTVNNGFRSSENYQSYLFVKKIKDINYDDVIDKACSDYADSICIITESFSSGEPKARYDRYLNETITQFETMYRMKIRNHTGDVDLDSQNFYDDFSLSPVPTFSGYEQTQSSFRNGVMHIQMDVVDDHQKWKWKLCKMQ